MDETRKNEILEKLKGVSQVDTILPPLVDEIVFLEGRLKELKALPFIKIDPKNDSNQKKTPAFSEYKELLQQYNNCLKTLCTFIVRAQGEEGSDLRQYFEMRKKKMGL